MRKRSAHLLDVVCLDVRPRLRQHVHEHVQEVLRAGAVEVRAHALAHRVLKMHQAVLVKHSIRQTRDAGGSRGRLRAVELAGDEDGGCGGQLQVCARELTHRAEVPIEQQHAQGHHVLHMRGADATDQSGVCETTAPREWLLQRCLQCFL